MMTNEKLKRRALTPIAHHLEVALALHTSINSEMLAAMNAALSDAYNAGRMTPLTQQKTEKIP